MGNNVTEHSHKAGQTSRHSDTAVSLILSPSFIESIDVSHRMCLRHAVGQIDTRVLSRGNHIKVS